MFFLAGFILWTNLNFKGFLSWSTAALSFQLRDILDSILGCFLHPPFIYLWLVWFFFLGGSILLSFLYTAGLSYIIKTWSICSSLALSLVRFVRNSPFSCSSCHFLLLTIKIHWFSCFYGQNVQRFNWRFM